MPIPAIGTHVAWEVRNPLGPNYENMVEDGVVVDRIALQRHGDWNVRMLAMRAGEYPGYVLINTRAHNVMLQSEALRVMHVRALVW